MGLADEGWSDTMYEWAYGRLKKDGCQGEVVAIEVEPVGSPPTARDTVAPNRELHSPLLKVDHRRLCNTIASLKVAAHLH